MTTDRARVHPSSVVSRSASSVSRFQLLIVTGRTLGALDVQRAAVVGDRDESMGVTGQPQPEPAGLCQVQRCARLNDDVLRYQEPAVRLLDASPEVCAKSPPMRPGRRRPGQVPREALGQDQCHEAESPSGQDVPTRRGGLLGGRLSACFVLRGGEPPVLAVEELVPQPLRP
jgi:hypothetical protein